MADERRETWWTRNLTAPTVIWVATVLVAGGGMYASVQASNAEQDRRLQVAEAEIRKAAGDTSTILQAIAELRADVRNLSRAIDNKGK